MKKDKKHSETLMSDFKLALKMAAEKNSIEVLSINSI